MMRVRKNPKPSAPLLVENLPDIGPQQRLEKLLQAISEGDRSALATLYTETSSMVFGLILRIVGESPLAEEVLLEVFQQIWREAPLYPAKGQEPLAWMLGIARSRALICRQQGNCTVECGPHKSRASRPDASQQQSKPVSFITRQQRLARAALASLSSSQRAVIELAYYQGLSQSEIASKLGMSLEAVKTDTRLAMMKLREYLNPVPQEQL